MLALGLLALLSVPAGAVEIANPGFEQGATGWMIETGTAGSNMGGPNRVEFVSEGAFEGSTCAKLCYRSSWLWLTTSSLPGSVSGRRTKLALRAKWLSGDSHLGVYGLIGPDWRLPITVGAVLRRNHLRNNASIVLGSEATSARPAPLGRTDPLVTDVLVEGNTVEDSDLGLCVFGTAHRVYSVGNQFRNVGQEQWNEAEALVADGEP